MADPLIHTKLRLPFIRPGLVARPQIQARLAAGLHGPLTLVVAPAGFGKTTLAASVLAGGGRGAVAWLSLDKDDNQAGRFLAYLVAALQAADPRIGREAARLLAGMQPAPPEAALTSLINDLDALPGQLVLALDDYHCISSPVVHASVTFLIEHCPRTFHLLIATRSDPPLPLARLRARGQLVELRTADLRFTPPEAARLLNDEMGLGLDTGLVSALEEQTEGWAAGLQMAALSLRDRGDARGFIESFSGTHRYILDYLLEEVLAHQPPEIQHFLLSTSVLERLCAPLCDAVIESREARVESRNDSRLFTLDSRSTLEYLDRENLFLVPLDDERTWFRYHHLFADLLRARLHQAQPDLAPRLHRQASAWLEQNGFIPDAVQHLFAAHAESQAADLIERYGPARWAESDPSVVRMAATLPPEMLVARPKIGFYQAWLLIIDGNIEKAIPLLNALAQQVAGASSEQAWIRTLTALALAFLGIRTGPDGADMLPEYPALDAIPAGEVVLRDTADVLYAMTLGRRGEIDRAAAVALRCIRREKAAHADLIIPTLVPFLARTYLMQGHLHEAAALCRSHLDSHRRAGSGFIYAAGNLNVILGEALFEWNDLKEAEKQIRSGLQSNEPWADIMSDAFGLLALERVLRAKGDFAGVMQTVEKFETRLKDHLRPHEFEEDFHTLRVRARLASGDLPGAAEWADQVILSEDFQLHAGRYRLTLAHIRLAQGRPFDVETVLTGMADPATGRNRTTRQIESKLLLATAYAGQQHLPEAFDLVAACLALAEPEGYIRIFLEVGNPVRELLAAYLRSSGAEHKPFAQKVLKAFSPSGASSSGPRPAGLIEPLSERELEVLRLMALGRTNPEIAGQLVVALGTVKAHAASIYRKLDAANRTEAVAHARRLGLLD